MQSVSRDLQPPLLSGKADSTKKGEGKNTQKQKKIPNWITKPTLGTRAEREVENPFDDKLLLHCAKSRHTIGPWHESSRYAGSSRKLLCPNIEFGKKHWIREKPCDYQRTNCIACGRTMVICSYNSFLKSTTNTNAWGSFHLWRVVFGHLCFWWGNLFVF